jgi:hypothetical protein
MSSAHALTLSLESSPARIGHLLERAAFALGRSGALVQDVSTGVWDRREAVLEARLGGGTLRLAALLEAEALGEDAVESATCLQARRWLAALRVLRGVPAAEPVLSPAHWRVAASCLVGSGGTDGGNGTAGAHRFARTTLRAQWLRHGGLAAAAQVATSGASMNPAAASLGRLAAHGLLHHSGLAAAAVAPLAAAAAPFDGPATGESGNRIGAEVQDASGRRAASRTAAWLRGVCRALEERHTLSQRLRDRVAQDAGRVSRLPRCAASTLAVLAQFQRTPVATITTVSHAAALCFPTTLRATQRLLDSGVVREVTGRRSGRVFAYEAYLALLEPDGGTTAEGAGRR